MCIRDRYLSDFAHTNLDPVRGLDFLGHFDTCFVFVRGGGKYHFYTSHGAQEMCIRDSNRVLESVNDYAHRVRAEKADQMFGTNYSDTYKLVSDLYEHKCFSLPEV